MSIDYQDSWLEGSVRVVSDKGESSCCSQFFYFVRGNMAVKEKVDGV